jgi:hypothetical protein
MSSFEILSPVNSKLGLRPKSAMSLIKASGPPGMKLWLLIPLISFEKLGAFPPSS